MSSFSGSFKLKIKQETAAARGKIEPERMEDEEMCQVDGVQTGSMKGSTLWMIKTAYSQLVGHVRTQRT